MKRGVRLENVFLASFYIPLKAFLYKKQLLFKLYSLSLLLASNPQLNFQQLSNNFLPCMRVLCLSFVLL